ncbi:MAG: glycosyltransferase family 39 protein [Solirubrobacterales bacterium]
MVLARRAGAYAATSWRQRRPWVIVAGLVAAGLVLRLLLMRGIWVDEAISVHQAQMSLPDMLDDLRETDRHPPLHYLILWVVVRLFGVGELAVRAPSILASVALVPALFVTARELFDRRTGLVAAALAAVAPLVIWYGQEARMYALFMLLATLALWAQVMVLRDGRRRYWVAYGAITIALLYTHYFAIIPIAIQQLVFAIAAWKRAHAGLPVRNLMIGCWLTWLALLLAAAPLAPFAHEQFEHDQAAGTGFGGVPGAGAPTTPDGSSVSAYAVLSNFVWAIWGYHADSTMLRIAALWPLLMLLSLGLLGQRRSASTRVVLALALGPVIALLLIGLEKRDLFEVRYFMGAVPMMLLLLARAVAGGTRRRTPALVASAVLVATLVVGLADQQLNSRNPRAYDFKGALTPVAERVRPGDTVVYAPEYLRDVIGYYAPGVEAVALEDQPTPPAKGRVFLVASFLEGEQIDRSVDEARAALEERGRLVDAEKRQQIRIWEYSS